MSNVAEFIAVRENIEALVRKVALSVEERAFKDSRRHFDEARKQLEVLEGMVANDVQVIAVGRLTRQLTDLGMKIARSTVKKAAPEKKRSKAV
jgi:hypothetical protein